MTALYYDLHIHSCLSPCADNDMTPANICAMARLKGLNMIALTDHQSAGNLRAAAACAKREGLCLVPGIEVCTREEVHVLAYFDNLEAAEQMGAFCTRHLPGIPNRPALFGDQLYADEDGRVTGREEALLLAALDMDLGQICQMIRHLGGVPVPAHINRGANGILGALGMIPKEEGFTALEVSDSLPLSCDVSAYRVLHSSDAHRLGDIAEAVRTLEIECRPRALLEWLRHAEGE